MNIGVQKTFTAVEWLEDNLIGNPFFEQDFAHNVNIFKQAKAMEKEQIKGAVMYGLDEDGHTGDWKISVAQNYYNKTFTDGDSGAKAD
jgi:hypothetical protein